MAGVGWLATSMPLGEAIGAVSLGGYLLAVLAVFLLPETRGLVLSASGTVPGAAPPVSTGKLGALTQSPSS